MERGALKIQPTGLPSRVPGGRWSLVRSSLDPAVVVVVYLAALWLWDRRFTKDDFIVLTIAIAILLPAELPFRWFTARVAVTLLSTWMKVALGVGLLWAAKYFLDLEFHAEPKVTASWLVAAPLAKLLLHCASPRIVPLLWPLYPPTKVIMVGVNGVAVRVAQSISLGEGQQFVGFFDDRSPDRLAPYGHQHPVIGGLDRVGDYVKDHRVGVIYIALPLANHPRVVALLASLRDTTASVHFLPDIFVADLIQGRVSTVAGVPVVSVCETPFDGAAGAMKRTLDLLLVMVSLPVVLPMILVIALLVRLTSPGPAFFVQRRYGLDGDEIRVLKFRTMTTLEDGEHTYRQVTRADPRVTRLGAFLRRTSLDELPQLINVLGGSMSLVGPRPHALAVNEQYRRLIPGYMVRHKVRPGITGWAQVNGCRGGDDLDAMRRRTEYDLAYLRSWSLALDLLIVAKTVKMLVVGDERAY